MLTLRQRIFIGFSVVVGIIIAVLLIVMWVRAPQDDVVDDILEGQEEEVIDSTTGPLIIENTADVAPQDISPPQAPEEVYLKNVARIFVERFYTYSNQNDNDHIADVKIFATADMQSWMNSQAQPLSNDDSYNGMTTRVLTTEVASIDSVAGGATVHIGVRQIMSSRENGDVGITEDVRMREGTVVFEYVDAEWKVAGVFWEE